LRVLLLRCFSMRRGKKRHIRASSILCCKISNTVGFCIYLFSYFLCPIEFFAGLFTIHLPNAATCKNSSRSILLPFTACNNAGNVVFTWQGTPHGSLPYLETYQRDHLGVCHRERFQSDGANFHVVRGPPQPCSCYCHS
jgi:hypothetical protein